MTEPRSPLDHALDLVFFGPLGLAITAGEELPRMIEKGRSRVGPQIMVARMIGELAVKQGQHMASSAIKQSTEVLVGLGIIPASPSAPSHRPSDDRSGAGQAAGDHSPARPPAASTNGRTTDTVSGPAEEQAASATPLSADLAIPGYDSLSAAQVVQRLAGLAHDELEAVRRYEAAGRGRRTILNKIAQLQTGRS